MFTSKHMEEACNKAGTEKRENIALLSIVCI